MGLCKLRHLRLRFAAAPPRSTAAVLPCTPGATRRGSRAGAPLSHGLGHRQQALTRVSNPCGAETLSPRPPCLAAPCSRLLLSLPYLPPDAKLCTPHLPPGAKLAAQSNRHSSMATSKLIKLVSLCKFLAAQSNRHSSMAASWTMPIECMPLSTYMVIPVTAPASGERRKAAVLPTSLEVRSLASGAFALQ